MTPRIRALLLAAGRSSRTGTSHKLLAQFDGVSLVRRSALTVLASRAASVSVVVGHRAEAMRAALAGLPIAIVENDCFAEGLSTSLIAGFRAVPSDAEGVLVMLADQPLLTADHLDRMIATFRPEGRGSLVVATHDGRRFNPVVIASRYREEIEELTGDIGARQLFSQHSYAVAELELGTPASFDVDDLASLIAAGGVPERR